MIRCADRTMRDVDLPFWEFCAKDELHMQRCAPCGAFQWPPAQACGGCSTPGGLQWQLLSGRGVLRSACLFERQYLDECPPPWAVILVELDEGPLIISRPDGFDAESAADGAPVEVRFVPGCDEHGEFRLPVFAQR
jgi:uncharacterized OB-fold protein